MWVLCVKHESNHGCTVAVILANESKAENLYHGLCIIRANVFQIDPKFGWNEMVFMIDHDWAEARALKRLGNLFCLCNFHNWHNIHKKISMLLCIS